MKVSVEVAAIGELHAVRAGLAIDDGQRVYLRVDGHAQVFDFPPQHARARVVHLHGHQARCEFHHMRFQLHVAQRLGALEAQQATANDHAGARALQRLTAVVLDPVNARLLGVADKAAALQMERVSRTQNDRIVEYTRSLYRGDAYDFIAELKTGEVR